MAHLIAFPALKDPEPGPLWPRLLTLAQAATYCGVTPMAFERLCPVQPVAAWPDPQSERYDRQEIDAWIAEKCGDTGQTGWQNWLALMEGKTS